MCRFGLAHRSHGCVSFGADGGPAGHGGGFAAWLGRGTRFASCADPRRFGLVTGRRTSAAWQQCLARRAGDCVASNGMGAALLSSASIPSYCKLDVGLDRPNLGNVTRAHTAAVGGCSQFCRWSLALACCDDVVRYFGGQQIGARIFFKGKVSSRHMNIAQALQTARLSLF